RFKLPLTCATVYTIEFQKRGLPHAHILLLLQNASTVKSGKDIDELICAEIPCKDTDPAGQRMLHGPCGEVNKKAPCMINGHCTKHFPNPYYAETTLDEDGFPMYKRRNNGVAISKDKGNLNNRFVVPYNRYLLLKSRAIKYLFKYISKGPDKAKSMFMENGASVETSTTHQRTWFDEIKHFLECRYLSRCEDVWRIFRFDIHYCNPAVIRLTYHFPGQQYMTLSDAQNLPIWLGREQVSHTMFTEWFALNSTDIRNCPKSCVARKGDSLGRQQGAETHWKNIILTPNLRMLLNVVKGPRSFEEIRTVRGKVYAAFCEACYALGMPNDDTEWTDAIQEASIWASGFQLRQLFVTILLFCDQAISEDILHQKRKQFKFPALELSENQIKTYCLLHIEQLPGQMESHCQIILGYLYPTRRLIDTVQSQASGHYFIYGVGGTGKTFVYQAIMARIRAERNIVLAVASSGIAALLLLGGRTTHSRFVIPIELLEHSTCGITQNSHLEQLMHEVKLIIWDESLMTQRYAFEALNRTLQDIMGIKNENNRQKILGGIPVLLGGDFWQILPVITKGRRQEIVQACISISPLWDQCEVFMLLQNMRFNAHHSLGEIDDGKKRFNTWTKQVGEGIAPAIALEDEDEESWIRILDEFLIHPKENPIQQLIDEIYPMFNENNSNHAYLQQRAILTPLNQDAD
ncbi:hypothetical protein V2J09_011145, partial [Rumex salicifolius]